jgi:Putative archaeal flagellar protein D/E
MKPEVLETVNETLDVAQEESKETVEETVEVVEEVAEAAEEPVAEEVPEAVEEAKEEVADVVEEVKEEVKEAVEEVKETVVNYGEKTLAELSGLFQELTESADRMKRSKEAEAIKSAFYKLLSREKAEAGEDATVDEPDADTVEEIAATEPLTSAPVSPFAAIEAGFKSLYNSYKKERAEYNRQLDAEREENLVKKQAVIEDLKALIDEQGDMKDSFPKFREIQNRWREVGPVPQQNFRDVNDTYQLYVEKFYDLVQINRELRDLDFRKNLEAKTEFCEQAEALAESEDVVGAFKELQKLHEQWKEYGPVAKEFRDSIWERFRAATAVINKKYQAHFEGLKEQHAANLEAKSALCEKVEAIAAQEITSSNQWNALSKEIEAIQAEWRKIGFATRKDNQKVYDRFRAACDQFFTRKREYYNEFKDSMNDNMAKKLAIIEQAEALKDSTDWKKTSDALIELQRQWKEIGAVPRKKSEQLWKRFRAACDAFFNERDKQSKPENDFYGNLKAKRALIEEIEAYVPADAEADAEAAHGFAERWSAIGFVPFKEKEAVGAAYKAAMQAKFPDWGRGGRREGGRGPVREPRRGQPLTEKDKLTQKYNQLQQDIQTYENNIGFFGLSKGAEQLKAQMQERIDAAKEDLRKLEAEIRELVAKEAEENND